MSTFSIVCLSPQEWNAALPTNRQQIMLRAAGRGHAVVFVETGAFLGRHLRSRASAAQILATTEVAPGIRVRKAINLLPWGHKRRLSNSVNARLTALAVRRLARGLPQPVVLWSYDPCAADLVGRCGESVALYDCVDDYAELQGPDAMTRALLAAMDAESAARSTIVSTTSRYLHERHLAANAATYLVRNVGDYGHFAEARPAPALADLPRPLIGFAGNLHAGKVDFALVAELSRRRPDWTFVLVGPAHDSAAADVEAIAHRDNVHWLGHAPYAKLPSFVSAFDVGVIPYLANAYTRSCFPLKLYEYLAAGKPVVASGLPELEGMEPDVALVDDADGFERAIERALLLSEPADRERRRTLAAANTWDERAGRLLGLVRDALEA